MRWTERQRAMLREMGVQIWSHESAAGAAGEATVAAERSEAPVPVPASAETPPARATAPHREPIAGVSSAKLAPADWLVVGEPFDGAQQEQLLDNMLRAIGVARSAPARGRRATFVAVATSGAAADRDEMAAAIAAVAPRAIITLGRAAAAAVLGSDAPLGHWRGRRHEHAAVPVVVTFSLAFLLRHPEEKAKAWADLCLAVAGLAPSAA
jgi:uracil-DNA glycosylase